MVVVGNEAIEDFQDGELGVDDQQLGNQAVNGEQPEGAEKEGEPQGNSDEENPVRMASRMTSKKKRRQELRSPPALLAWGHSALISRRRSSSWGSLWLTW
jgi:hypothetical protein